jgi:hypothetical protein
MARHQTLNPTSAFIPSTSTQLVLRPEQHPYHPVHGVLPFVRPASHPCTKSATELQLPRIRAFRDCRRQLQDARATTDAGLADQLVNWSRALLLYAFNGHVGAVAPSLEHGYTLTERPVR